MADKYRTIAKKIISYIIDNLRKIATREEDAVDKVAQILKDNFDKTTHESREFVAYFDGSSVPNPGAMKVGGHIDDLKGKTLWTLSKSVGYGTNNIAEYTALIKVLEELIDRGATKVQLYGDSQLVVDQVNLQAKVNRGKFPHIGELFDLARERLGQIKEWKLSHIKRKYNKVSDMLSK